MWTEITEERYHEMMDILPPASYSDNGFLVGEPITHRACTVSGHFAPEYDAYAHINGKYYAGGGMTEAEFRTVTLAGIFGN